MTYTFVPPGTERPMGADRLWARFNLPVSFTLLKKDGFYTLAETPADEDVAAADAAYLSGHEYTVSDAEAALLTAAGYGDCLDDGIPDPPPPPVDPDPNVIDPPEYGLGYYGGGIYGS